MQGVEKASISIDRKLWEKFRAFITMTYESTQDVTEYAERALREYMEHHTFEFDE